MTNPNDPIVPRKRTREELPALYQQMNSCGPLGSTISMPPGIEDEIIGGLTKREYFFCEALKCVVQLPNARMTSDYMREAHEWADMMILELNK